MRYIQQPIDMNEIFTYSITLSGKDGELSPSDERYKEFYHNMYENLEKCVAGNEKNLVYENGKDEHLILCMLAERGKHRYPATSLLLQTTTNYASKRRYSFDTNPRLRTHRHWPRM